MPLALEALEVREAVAVSDHHSVAGEVVAFTRHLAVAEVDFTHHLPASIRVEGLAGSISRLVASTDLLLMVARTHLTLVRHRVFMAFMHTLRTRMGQPVTGSLAMR
jgi:hypothetical protein